MRRLLWKFKTSPVRTLLTALQVALASFAITLTLSVYLTPEDPLAANTFYLIAGYEDENTGGQYYSVFDPDDLEALTRLVPDIEALGVYEGVNSPVFVYNGKRFQFRGGATVSPEYFSLRSVDVIQGSAFSSSEAETEEAVVLISDAAARIIFGEADPLGQNLLGVSELSSAPRSYRVIGTFADANGEAAASAPAVYYPTWAPGDTVVSLDTFAASRLIVRARSGRSEAAGTQLLAAIRRQYQDHPQLAGVPVGRDFYVTEQTGSTNLGPQLNPNLVIFGLFGAMALVIGSIGVFSSTVVSVVERGHEIGIKRALGATGGAVSREFAAEVLLLSLISSLLGTGLAAVAIPPLVNFLGTLFFGGAVAWRPSAALIAVGVTAMLAGVLGTLPAYQAGRLKPIDNLRS